MLGTISAARSICAGMGSKLYTPVMLVPVGWPMAFISPAPTASDTLTKTSGMLVPWVALAADWPAGVVIEMIRSTLSDTN